MLDGTDVCQRVRGGAVRRDHLPDGRVQLRRSRDGRLGPPMSADDPRRLLQRAHRRRRQVQVLSERRLLRPGQGQLRGLSRLHQGV